MNFQSYAERIRTLQETDDEHAQKKKKKVQKRLQVNNTEMKMTSVNKVQFASLNNKRYYFSDGIISLPCHPLFSILFKNTHCYQKRKRQFITIRKSRCCKK